MRNETTLEAIADKHSRQLLGIPEHFYTAREHRCYRNWSLAQATLKGWQSAVNNRYKAIHKRGLTVDHIVPLNGQNEFGDHVVCGLNVPWNLRGENRADNQKKGCLFVDSNESLGIIVAVVNEQLRINRLK